MPESPEKSSSWSAHVLRISIALCLIAITATHLAERLRPDLFPHQATTVAIGPHSSYSSYYDSYEAPDKSDEELLKEVDKILEQHKLPSDEEVLKQAEEALKGLPAAATVTAPQ